VALAAALGAEQCEIYSDVDGVYSADPNRVPSARHLPELDYDTMEEMAVAGARVLNVHAVRTAREHGLCVLARRTADFVRSGSGRQTRVVAGARSGSAIVVDASIALLYGPAEARATLGEAARNAELVPRELTAGAALPLSATEEHLLAAIPLGGVPDAQGALETLKSAAPNLRVVTGYGELSAIGDVAAHPELCRAAVSALPVAPLCAWETPRRSSAIVPLEQMAESERIWHELWIERSSIASGRAHGD
jgi:aspartate kinase